MICRSFLSMAWVRAGSGGVCSGGWLAGCVDAMTVGIIRSPTLEVARAEDGRADRQAPQALRPVGRRHGSCYSRRTRASRRTSLLCCACPEGRALSQNPRLHGVMRASLFVVGCRPGSAAQL
ncbi:hypothetical protein D3C84_1019010 [compost metagenome]